MTADRPGAAAGPDGKPRCPWALGATEYLAYHDEEWGCPVRDDPGMFERLSLEAFQSGLSWLTILRKRENFRSAFKGFNISAVADYGPDDVTRLLADPGIVRNRAKIEAVIRNARAALELPDGLAATVWRHARDQVSPPDTLADVPAGRQNRRRSPPNSSGTGSISPARLRPTRRCRPAGWWTIT